MMNMEKDNLQENAYDNSWFFNTLSMMMLAHRNFKQKKYEVAIEMATAIEAQDWRIAAVEWIERRAK
jgi:DNA polymerase III delta subunit